MASSPRSIAITLVLLTAACAGAPPSLARPSFRDAVWPPPPQAPRLRVVAIHPDPRAPPPHRAWWRVALEWLTGAEQTDEERLALARPFGVALADGGTLYVADPDGPRVVRIDARGTLDDLRCRDRVWAAPIAVALSADGALYVADAGAAVVVRWTQARCDALGEGLLERPTGVAVSADRVWVADPPRHQVIALSPSGALLARVGEKGDGDGRFHYPTAVALGPDGDVLVVDALNFRVVRLGADGGWRGAFGTPGDEGGDFARPKAIAVARDGEIFVSDAQRDAVLVFAPDGSFRYAAGATGAEPGRFVHPAGVAVASGKLAIADSQNHRIQVLEMLGGRP